MVRTSRRRRAGPGARRGEPRGGRRARRRTASSSPRAGARARRSRRPRGRAAAPELLATASGRSSSPTRSTAAASGSSTSARPATSPPTRSCASGFTAAVSHELRTPLARLLALLETALLPGEDVADLVEQARREVEQIRELIDEVLFLSELETGRASSRSAPRGAARPARGRRRARRAGARAGVDAAGRGRRGLELPLRPRMLRVVAENLAENAIRYAGPGANVHALGRARGRRGRAAGADDGVGVAERRPPAALRALLPRRPRARLARHRPRARDREARRHRRRRHRRGARRSRARARDPLRRSPPGRSSFTTLSPDLHQPAPHCRASAPGTLAA